MVIAVARTEEAPAYVERERAAYDGGTAIKLYLREIGQVKLLTPQEEIELAAKIKKGDKKAREQMIKANLRLVVKIARDYEGIGLPLLDLISEGNIGLMKAVERFDPAKGGKLSTYGSWWIKQSIKRALANQSKTIRLPVHLVDKISKMRRAAMKLQENWAANRRTRNWRVELRTSASRIAQMRAVGDAAGVTGRADWRRGIEQFFGDGPGRECVFAVRATGGKDGDEHVAGNGGDAGPARGDDPALPVWAGRREREDAGAGGREIRRHPRTGAAGAKPRAAQTPRA